MRKLVDSWIRAEREQYGNDLAAAIGNLNGTIKTPRTPSRRVEPSRLNEWKAGKYAPSQIALSAMLYRALPWMLKQAGIAVSVAQWHELEGLIWTVVDENGVRYVELACATRDEG